MRKKEKNINAEKLRRVIHYRISDIFNIVCFVVMGLWYFFWGEYSFSRVYDLLGQTLLIGGYIIVSLYIILHVLKKNYDWVDFVSVTAVPAAIIGLPVVPSEWLGTALVIGGGVIAISVIIALAAFFVKYKKGKIADRLRMSCDLGKKNALLLISAFLVLAVSFSAIYLNSRASIAEPPEGLIPSVNAEATDSAEMLLSINENWSGLSKRERLAALQTAADYMCKELEIEPVTVKIGAFEGTINTTRYYGKRNEVAVAVSAVEADDYTEALFAAARGAYNAYQAECAERYRTNPACFDGDWINGYNASCWADEIKKSNSGYWKYWDSSVENAAFSYAKSICEELEYSCLQYAVENGGAVLSEPMKINNSTCDYRLAVYPSHIELYSYLDTEKAISCGVLAPVEEFEDINGTLKSISIDENMSAEESPNALDDVIQFTDRGNLYRYAFDSDTLKYVLVGKGKVVEPEKIVYAGVEWEGNPIDSFFERYVLHDSTSSNADMTAYEMARGDMWLAEVDNAYRLMKESINTNQSEERQQWYADTVQQAHDDFLAFAENGSYIEALTGPTNVFAIDDGFDGVYAGTALSGYHSRLLADTYRAEALRIYDALEFVYDWSDAEEVFVFDEEDFLSNAESEYGIIFVEWEEDK